jgi:Mg-chelatase subunit ChlD
MKSPFKKIKRGIHRYEERLRPSSADTMPATAFKVNADTCAVSVSLPSTETRRSSPIALHFIVDNSASMGSLSREVIHTFADMIDAVASKPCSLTTFSDQAKVLSSTLHSSQDIKNLPDQPQGGTNIPSGVCSSLGLIFKAEGQAKREASTTHHVMVILTDGQHNRGETPERVFPLLRNRVAKYSAGIKLSVVVVGFSRNSSTSMGMLLKTSIETVPLDP